ncbi:MAG: metallophosphoesterase [Arenicellales bacterium]
MTRFTLTRRRFLLLGGYGLAAGAGAYTYVRGIRFPPLDLVSDGPRTAWHAHGSQVSARGAFFRGMDGDSFRFRAFVPEPAFKVSGAGSRTAHIVVENLHRESRLDVDTAAAAPGTMNEERDNLVRIVSVKPAAGTETGFSWRFPKQQQYRFAAIGDSGGGTELHWVLKRAAQLGADFLVHLGDLYYEKGDLNRALANFGSADIPAYVAIGNHDFSDNWHAKYPVFHRLIGPGNWVFTLGGVEFVNFDTAALFIPAVRGARARLIQGLQAVGPASAIRDRVAITHKPLTDPDPKRSHAVGSSEARWLREQLLSRGTRNLLVGHIHIKDEFDDQGLYTRISGQGLAHADLIVGHAYAQILLGDVEPGQPVRYQWQPLKMPFGWHCNRRNIGVIEALDRPKVEDRLLKECGKT